MPEGNRNLLVVHEDRQALDALVVQVEAGLAMDGSANKAIPFQIIAEHDPEEVRRVIETNNKITAGIFSQGATEEVGDNTGTDFAHHLRRLEGKRNHGREAILAVVDDGRRENFAAVARRAEGARMQFALNSNTPNVDPATTIKALVDVMRLYVCNGMRVTGYTIPGPTDGPIEGNMGKFLIVNDNPDTLNYWTICIERGLTKMDPHSRNTTFDILTATSLKEGKQVIEGHPDICAAMLDYRLDGDRGEQTGTQLTYHLREKAEERGQSSDPIVAIGTNSLPGPAFDFVVDNAQKARLQFALAMTNRTVNTMRTLSSLAVLMRAYVLNGGRVPSHTIASPTTQ